MIEYLGYFASFIVLVAVTMKSIEMLRVFSIIGGALFGLYGALIESYPTVFMNTCMIIINIYYLVKIYKQKKITTII